MMIECSICTSNLLENSDSNPPCAISCGHVYHKNCLDSWQAKGSGCPQCRKPIKQTIPLYFPGDTEQRHIELLMKNIVTLNSGIEARDREMKNGMDLLLATIQSLSISVGDLKKDNSEMKRKINELEFNGPIGAGSGEQMKAKNALIENLRKENQDLKIQRAQYSKELNEVNTLVANLKANRTPLKAVSGNEQQSKALTLSLKFDDINDQLIVNDAQNK